MRYDKALRVGYSKAKRRKSRKGRIKEREWCEQKPKDYEPNLLSPDVALKQVSFYDGYNRDSQWDFYFKMRQL